MSSASTVAGVAIGAQPLSGAVYQIAGGPAMDKLLSRRFMEEVGWRIPNSRVLDIGVGRADNTLEIWRRSPRLIVATDFEEATIEMGRGHWIRKEYNPDDINWALYDANETLPTEFGNFDLINYSSVAMHQKPENVRATVAHLVSRLKPRGVLFFAVVSSEFASRNFIRASGESTTPMFYPRTKGMTLEMTEADLTAEQTERIHTEYYPPSTVYDDCCSLLGVTTRKCHGVVGHEFENTIYSGCNGQAYWDFWVMTREE